MGYMAARRYPSAQRAEQAIRRRKIEQVRRRMERFHWPVTPEQGWLAEVRTSSGVSTRDVADRLGVNQSVLVRFEKAERAESITLGSLRRYADGLDADLRYIVVPRANVLQHHDSEGRRRRDPLRVRASPKRGRRALTSLP
jgi:transcriptional regulator with XRE-family HTH domain